MKQLHTPSPKVMTLTIEAIEGLRNSCSARGLSPATGKSYASDLRGLLLWTSGPSIPMQDYPHRTAEYLNDTKAEARPKTTERRITSMRAFATWAGWEPVLTDYKAPIPAPAMPHPIPEGIVGIDRMAQVARTAEHRAVLALCGFCGLRIAESLAVRLCDFHLTEMTLTVRGKGDKERIVPVSEGRALPLLLDSMVKAMSTPKAPLVRLSESTARKAVTSMGKRAKLQRHVSSHDLRVTFATHLSNTGVPIRVIQTLLGHSNLKTTEIYTQVLLDQMRTAVAF